MDAVSLRKLPRKALQRLAKTNGIKANLKSEDIIELLLKKQEAQPSAHSPQHIATATSKAGQRQSSEEPPQHGNPDPARLSDPLNDPGVGTCSAERHDYHGLMHIKDPRGPPASMSHEPSVLSETTGDRPPRDGRLYVPPPSGSYALPSFQHLVSTLPGPGHGPSHYIPQAHTLNVFDVSSASRALWPYANPRPPEPSPTSDSHSPQEAYPASLPNSTEYPKGPYPSTASTSDVYGFSLSSSHHGSQQAADRYIPPLDAGASASTNTRAAPIAGGSDIGPSYRPRNPTPTEEYDSLLGGPAFTEPGSDYVEEWTPYTCEMSAGPSDRQPRPSAAERPMQSPAFPLTQAVFEPPARPAYPPRDSPVFRPPSTPQSRAQARPPAQPLPVPTIQPPQVAVESHQGEAQAEEEIDWATDEELHSMVSKMATLARHMKARWDDIEPMMLECNRTGKSVLRLRTILRQERARFDRMREYLGHLNVRLSPDWVEEEIWDKACPVRADKDGNIIEIETDDEEEAEWRRKHPRPYNAQPTEIIMKKYAPVVSVEDSLEDLETIVPRAAIAFARLHEGSNIQSRQGPLPQTPKRRRDGGDPGRAAKRTRGSAGRTPAPKAFLAGNGAGAMERERQQRKSLSLAEIVEEEEDMEMTSVVTMLNQPIYSSDRSV
ncbi:hypothetical protein BD309DRAFT_1039242 [Dichomitus squalens]|uniref:Uncharacterized protein n=1 Tax=Dichomitus squalens TaxID=114155 RepID=A0A4Q9PY02_9APHY|nr:hypothetical protein BD309DRAFT_1039242 [Dichomitus squalens]TBU59633.1 hypothetical protein BD310DRAFT_1008786 [Dichomitus squalens]